MVKIKLSTSRQNKLPIVKILQGVLGVVVVGYLVFVGHKTPSHSPAHENISVETQQNKRKTTTTTTTTKSTSNTDNNSQVINKQQQQEDTSTAPTIAYAVSVTGCGSDPLEEGAAVLRHSIHLASIHGHGRYDYQMYAIYHPDAAKCATPLADLGYTLLERPTPVQVQDIQGEFLRTHIEANGCCGEKELIKLEAYTLTQHPVVVHLDLDVLVLQPLDNLFDAMIHGGAAAKDKITVQWPQKPFPERVDTFFTRDYNMAHAGMKHPPVQGGFLVVRPDMDVYNEYLSIIKQGDFRSGKGWGGQVGAFYGGMTIQGIVPYYYGILHPENAVELDHCEFNQMCNNPRDKPTVNDVVSGRCRTGEEECQDCREFPLEKVVTTHFTLCQKPWWCLPHDGNRIQERLCRKLLHEWFRIRSDLEKSWGRSGIGEGANWEQSDHFYGYCKKGGKGGYIPIAKPYGSAAVN